MLGATVLRRLFQTERLRRQSTTAGFAVPGLFERAVPEQDAPFVASNMRSGFVLTRRSIEGNVRHGFSEVALDDEDGLLAELFRALWGLGSQHHWPNRCNSIEQARARLEALGLAPDALVIPPTLVEEAAGQPLSNEDIEKLMVGQGHIAQAGGARVMVADLPVGTAMLCSGLLGFYTRVDNWLGLLVQRADRCVILVGADDVA